MKLTSFDLSWNEQIVVILGHLFSIDQVLALVELFLIWITNEASIERVFVRAWYELQAAIVKSTVLQSDPDTDNFAFERLGVQITTVLMRAD